MPNIKTTRFDVKAKRLNKNSQFFSGRFSFLLLPRLRGDKLWPVKK